MYNNPGGQGQGPAGSGMPEAGGYQQQYGSQMHGGPHGGVPHNHHPHVGAPGVAPNSMHAPHGGQRQPTPHMSQEVQQQIPQQFMQPQQPQQQAGVYQQTQQAFVPGPATYGYYAQDPSQQQQQPQQPQFFMPGPPVQDGNPAGGGLPDINPLNFMVAGSNLLSGGAGNWGQQYVQKVQQRMSWFTGTALNVYFAVNKSYVASKMGMLLAPYLRQWTFTRQADSSGQQFQSPRTDVNAPDLYVPITALWTYVVLLCTFLLIGGKFKPDVVYGLVWNASAAWVVHALVASLILRAMQIQTSVSWLDLIAYTGYSYVLACVVLIVGFLGGAWAYYGAMFYGALSMSVFLVRTVKRIMFAEARNYGRDLTATNYLLLSLALFQFPFMFWLTSVRLPVLSTLLRAAFPAAANTTLGVPPAGEI